MKHYLQNNSGLLFLTAKVSLLYLVMMLSFSQSALSQNKSDSLWSYSTLRMDANQDDTLDYLGSTVTVGGIVNTASGQIHTNNLKAFLQNEHTGFPLFSKDIGASFEVGDSLVVTGELQNYDGMNEIYVESYRVFSEVDKTFTPVSFSDVADKPEKYIGMLVGGTAKIIDKGKVDNGKYLEVSTEGSIDEPLVIYLSNFHKQFNEFDFELLSIGDKVQVKGILGRYRSKTGAIYYPIYLRTPAGLEYAGVPRYYFSIGIGALVVILLAIGAWIVSLRQQVDHKTERIQESLDEKDVLLREIHHRVKNNLSIISGLIGLQLDSTEDEKAQDVLKDSQSRIQSMALIHDKLYQTESLSDIQLDNYLHELVEAIHGTFTEYSSDVELKFDLEPADIDIDHVIPCGLLVNELVVNAFKHAFTAGQKGVLTVSLKKINGKVELMVADNGPGLPDDFSFGSGESLGSMLIQTFATQLEAETEIITDGESGAAFKFTFALNK
ncbi:sensor histidine kinase [Fodinibius halophilus]|uniref:histidine kinase n=1 Tax=Fodinibius halophilus TaxID=1736908 RepID=A0A6M1TN11_9BACT|nr:sensor histidine kinase [Fodinibius halophilus]NGP89730.1 sensor histidine kinase [Fodinibius halophilus]